MNSVKIDKIDGHIITDSREQPTIEVILSSGEIQAKAAVPSGKSKGSYEAFSVSPEKAVENIKFLEKQLTTASFENITDFDNLLLKIDGTEDKGNLGANVTLALSMAFIRLLALTNNLPLYRILQEISGTKSSFPLLFFNLINGGLHAPSSLNPLPIQEYLVIPSIVLPSKSLDSIYGFIKVLEKVLVARNQKINFGDEGGFVISGDNPRLGLEILKETTLLLNAEMDFKFGLDIAASSLPKINSQIGTCYKLKDKCLTKEELMKEYEGWRDMYPLLSIEDPLGEEDFEGWSGVKQKLGDTIWIIGDDLTVTNTERIKKAEEQGSANAVIIKPNQIGTVSETIEAIKLAKSYGWKTIVSHRSGETEDDFIADLAYGVGADGLKSGSPLQKQRLVKYRRLIQIEKEVLKETT